MKQFMLAVHAVEGAAPPAPEVMQRMFADVAAFNERLKAEGLMIFGGGLRPAAGAKVVRAGGKTAAITDGPFSEAKEVIGGFWIVKAPSMAAALELARDASVACQQPVEVREFQEPAP